MLNFLKFIAEGGNITFGKKGDTNAPQAAPFPVTAQTRHHVRNEMHNALASIHDTFHKATGEHLFGKDKQRLHDATAYTGSSHDLMGHHVSHEEFAKHKPMVGDVDVQVSKEHKDALATHLQPGQKHGNFTVVGVKKHGDETSVGLKHNDTGHVHQVDFEGVKHPGSEADRFLHSSNWQDTKAGIKGAHHKMLINAVGGEKYKFSISHGLRSRTDESDPGVAHPTQVAHTLFGSKADDSKIHSFQGVTQLIKKHVPADQYQAIYDKFKSSLAGKKDMNHGPALEHLRKHLNVHDDVQESINEDLRKWFNQKWVRMDTKGNIKGDCAREEGEGKPKCLPMAKAQAMDKEDRAKAARRKRREDPVADREGKGGKPINVRTEAVNPAQQAAIAIAMKKAGKKPKNEEFQHLQEKNTPTNPELWSKAKSLARQKFDVYPSAYANGWAAKYYKSKGGGWKSINESYDVNSKHYKAITDLDLNTKNRDMTTQHDGYGPLNPNDEKGSKPFWEAKAKMWKTTVEAAKQARCGNCAAFNQSPAILKKIESALGPAGEKMQELADLGFCELFEFKCAGSRTCNKWIANGPIINEEATSSNDEQHAHVAFMGASPHTHMGHHIDVVGGMGKGKKFVGLSGKSDVFSDKEREDIANKQSDGDAEFKVEKSAGQTVGRAFHSMSGPGKKILHLHFGHDRKEMAERLKNSIEAGKIPELEGHKPDEVHIHYPTDENRSHGMSGTKMRTAAENSDLNTYKKHLGPNFSDKEAKSIMDRTRVGLMAGKIKVKR